MKAMLLAAALGAAVSIPAFAHTHIHDCDVSSAYSLTIKPDRLVFKRHAGTPAEIEISNGTLRVDGTLVATNAADTQRLRDAEQEVRALVPEMKGIARDAVAIAFDAVGQVAAAFAHDGAAARRSAEHIAALGREIDRKIMETDSFDHWEDADIDRLVGSTVEAVVPEIVGNVTAEALKVAFTGDEAAAAELEARANGIEKSVDRAVEKQAAQLEARATGICSRLKALDRVQSDMDVRLPDGSKLNLVSVD
ncbi:MAG TPA: DUF2884 family protein [Rhodanobacteraceae bacterium]|nr:DUF2884 family protein [Rhodanobacteraceae bacterium]